jgi:hypothetical protein
MEIAEFLQRKDGVIVRAHQFIGISAGELADGSTARLRMCIFRQLLEESLMASWHVTTHSGHEFAVGKLGGIEAVSE